MRLVLIDDVWIPVETVRLGDGMTGPGKAKGALVLAIPDDFAAAYRASAHASPDTPPGVGGACGTAPAGTSPGSPAGQPQEQENPGTADPGASTTSGGVSTTAARPS